MDRIRSLLLARTHVVVVDPDLVSSASTRPSRDVDVERLEDELLQLGFVLSLDLASLLRRLPYQAITELRTWMQTTLAAAVGARRPRVPAASSYATRTLSWLATSTTQPCPWCARITAVGALSPCGHLVCRACWDSTGFGACPTCHRRVTSGEPFTVIASDTTPRIAEHSGQLTLLHIAIDLVATARARLERLMSSPAPLSAADRGELETLIDDLGPRTASWLPTTIPVDATRAIAVARLWRVAPDRRAITAATTAYVRDATDVLRIACVLMGSAPDLVEPVAMGALSRSHRLAILEALERLPIEDVIEHVRRRRRLWQRIGERLHPFEYAARLPNVALVFAILRRTPLSTSSIGPALREHAVRLPFLYVEDDRIKAVAWAGPVEDALRAGNPRAALARLTHRPAELIRRADHLVRLAQSRQVDALQTLLKAVELASMKAPPRTMLTLAGHIARRGRPWPARVFFPGGDVLSAWTAPDRRTPMRGDAIAVMVGTIRRQLCIRAEACRQFPRAVIDRALVDLVVPASERPLRAGRIAWPRGTELALPDGPSIAIALDWQPPPQRRAELVLSIELFDAEWRHAETRRASRVELHLEQLALAGVRHAVAVIHGIAAVPFARFPTAAISVASPDEPAHRFELRGRSRMSVPITIDLAERRLRYLDAHLLDGVERVGGYRAALAHVARDFGDLISTHARPTLWDVACIHAAARANVVYIRERDGTFTVYRRRDTESKVARLGRMMSGAGEDGRVAALPIADAPTWFALMTGVPLPRGSVGYALADGGLPTDGIERVSALGLVTELAPVRS